MYAFQNVLALYSMRIGDEAALECASRLVSGSGGRLTVVDVVFAESITRRLLDERRQHLDRLAASIRYQGIDTATDVLVGRYHDELIRKVLRDGHDLVVLTDDRSDGLQESVFGCTCLHVMRKGPCPVWIVRPGAPPRVRNVLALVKASPASPACSLDVKVLQNAAAISRAHSSRLHVLHAWDVEGLEAETLRSEAPDDAKCRIRSQHLARHRRAVDGSLRAAGLWGAARRVHLPRGDACEMLPRVVDDHDVDLIVMGTHARGTLSDLVFRPRAESVLSRIDRSVIAVKPDEFVSPLALPGY